MQIPVGKVMPCEDDLSWKVVGSNPGPGKGFSSLKICVIVNFFENLVIEHLHSSGLSGIFFTHVYKNRNNF